MIYRENKHVLWMHAEHYSLVCKTLAAKKKCLHSQLSWSSILYTNRTIILLEIKVNSAFKKHTLCISELYETEGLPYSSFLSHIQLNNIHTSSTRLLKKNRETSHTLWIPLFGEVIKMSKWMETNANSKTAHTLVFGWFQKQTEQLKSKGKQWLISWMFHIQRL